MLLLALHFPRSSPTALLSSHNDAIPSAADVAKLPPATRALAAAAVASTRAEDAVHWARSRAGMAAAARASALRRAHAMREARRAAMLTDEPGVAEWVYNFEVAGNDRSEGPPQHDSPAFAPVYSRGLAGARARGAAAQRRLRAAARAPTQALGEVSDFPDIDEVPPPPLPRPLLRPR